MTEPKVAKFTLTNEELSEIPSVVLRVWVGKRRNGDYAVAVVTPGGAMLGNEKADLAEVFGFLADAVRSTLEVKEEGEPGYDPAEVTFH